ncbi:Indolepyruvate oxidoreductase subunit IorA [uncultured archaeon]|nr:Indolepyruvate oxidoreductase subunit IorA [uncultured archaeon]
MTKSFIRAEKCLCCAECLAAKACTSRAIFRLDVKEPAIIDAQFCHGCSMCIEACKGDAIITGL